ncbi:hypothetical protein ILUMI_26184 [Ignelater luminosus]|uniref:Uncharacterized protein n=1 Tax=Ignelater luminosus TaxID=2038154 RepID=A0A8K0C739_IGNLU|nr:hypothetical protein ILUMI_26184 [Ignelater luminosus]
MHSGRQTCGTLGSFQADTLESRGAGTDTAPETEPLVTLDTVPEPFAPRDTALKIQTGKTVSHDHISPEMVKYDAKDL